MKAQFAFVDFIIAILIIAIILVLTFLLTLDYSKLLESLLLFLLFAYPLSIDVEVPG